MGTILNNDRKFEAKVPWRISARGWLSILRRSWKDTGERDLSLVAGGVSYYLLLALFPALGALVSVYGLVASPADVTKNVQSLTGMLPAPIVALIGDGLRQLVGTSGKSLGLGAVIGFAIALWSSVRAMTGIMEALNIAYGQPERRGVIRFNATALVLTIVVIVGGLITLMLIVGLPIMLDRGDAGGPRRWIGLVIEWPLLIAFVMGIVALIYRYGANQSKPRWRWAPPGVIVATALWVAGSILFTIYIDHFGSYNKAYGSLSILLVLLSWIWMSVFVVLFGAEINGEAERQTLVSAQSNKEENEERI